MEDSWLREEKLTNASDLLWDFQLRHGIWLAWTYPWLLVLVGLLGVCPVLWKPPFPESVLYLGHISGQLGWSPWGEGIPWLFVIWCIPIHTRISYPLIVGHSGGGECRSYCLGSLYYGSNIPTHVYNTIAALWPCLYSRATAEVLGVKLY